MNLPIIRLEIEGMKQSVCVALTEYAAQIDANIQEAIKQSCTPENITRIIQATADHEIKQAITSEIENFFRWGNGRAAIKKAVTEILERT